MTAVSNYLRAAKRIAVRAMREENKERKEQ